MGKDIKGIGFVAIQEIAWVSGSGSSNWFWCECYDETGLVCCGGADQHCAECDGTGLLAVSVVGETMRIGSHEFGRGEDLTRTAESLFGLAVDSHSESVLREWIAPSAEMTRVIELSETPAAAEIVAVAS